MRDRLIELLDGRSLDTHCDVASVADHLLANGVIVPPCKVGDTVYAVTLNTNTFTYGVHRGYIACIDIRSTGKCIIIRHEGYDDEPYFEKIIGKFDDFGKSIFLSREEVDAENKRLLEALELLECERSVPADDTEIGMLVNPNDRM